MYLLAVVLYLWAFWFAYVLVMGLYRAHLARRMSRVTYVLAAPALLVGVLMDVLANIVIASVVFLEPPARVAGDPAVAAAHRPGHGHVAGLSGCLGVHAPARCVRPFGRSLLTFP